MKQKFRSKLSWKLRNNPNKISTRSSTVNVIEHNAKREIHVHRVEVFSGQVTVKGVAIKAVGKKDGDEREVKRGCEFTGTGPEGRKHARDRSVTRNGVAATVIGSEGFAVINEWINRGSVGGTMYRWHPRNPRVVSFTREIQRRPNAGPTFVEFEWRVCTWNRRRCGVSLGNERNGRGHVGKYGRTESNAEVSCNEGFVVRISGVQFGNWATVIIREIN